MSWVLKSRSDSAHLSIQHFKCFQWKLYNFWSGYVTLRAIDWAGLWYHKCYKLIPRWFIVIITVLNYKLSDLSIKVSSHTGISLTGWSIRTICPCVVRCQERGQVCHVWSCPVMRLAGWECHASCELVPCHVVSCQAPPCRLSSADTDPSWEQTRATSR